MGGNENGYGGDGFCVLILNFYFLEKKKGKKKGIRNDRRGMCHITFVITVQSRRL
jgi:hypothetical protein